MNERCWRFHFAALGAAVLSAAAAPAQAPLPSFRHHSIATVMPGRVLGLGGVEVADFDGDGRPDVIFGGVWFRTPPNPRERPFAAFVYDNRIRTDFHDLVAADIDGDNDIIIADCDGQNSGVAWMENNGKRPPHFIPRYLANRAPARAARSIRWGMGTSTATD